MSQQRDGWVDFNCPQIEILALVAGRTNEGVPIGILTTRLSPEDEAIPTNWLVRQDQLVRLRDDIDRLLGDRRSWLFLPEAEQQSLRFAPPEWFRSSVPDEEL